MTKRSRTTLSQRSRGRTRERWLAGGALLSVAAIWGSTFFMVKDATQSFPVFAFLTLRFVIAALVLLPFVLREIQRRGTLPARRDWAWGIGAGVLFAAGYIFQTFALRTVDAGRAGFITGLYAIFVPFLGLVVLRRPIERRVLIGGALAFVGMVLLGYAPGGTLLGDLLALLCALAYAGHILAIGEMPRSSDWRFLALAQSLTVAVLCGVLLPIMAAVRACDLDACAALAPFADALPANLPSNVLFVAAFTGVLATAFGLMVQVWAQRILPASDAALIFALEAPFAVLFGVIFLNEVLTLVGLAGCVLIFSGTLVVTVGAPQTLATDQSLETVPSEAAD
ncbi:MAG: DMT family transporter [Anaerolineae bacterium]|nr:DMT family transporter [Anaerolineae bacterium]